MAGRHQRGGRLNSAAGGMAARHSGGHLRRDAASPAVRVVWRGLRLFLLIVRTAHYLSIIARISCLSSPTSLIGLPCENNDEENVTGIMTVVSRRSDASGLSELCAFRKHMFGIAIFPRIRRADPSRGG